MPERYQIVPLRHPHDGLVPLVEAGVRREDDGEPTPIGGYYFSAFTGSGDEASSISLKVHAGNCIAANYYTNTVLIRTEPLNAENERLLTLATLKATMLAIVDAWNVTWASIYSRDLTALWPKPGSGPHFRMAWVTYLSPRFAPLVTPPRSTIVERTPQGGLVMIATAALFDVTNPAHLAVARDIEAAIGPVNALPWPPDATPE